MNLSNIINLENKFDIDEKIMDKPIFFRNFDLSVNNIERLDDFLYLIDAKNGSYPGRKNTPIRDFVDTVLSKTDFLLDIPPISCTRNPYNWRGKTCIVIPIKQFISFQSEYIHDLIDIVTKKSIIDIPKKYNYQDIYNYLFELYNILKTEDLSHNNLPINFYDELKKRHEKLYYNFFNVLANTYNQNNISHNQNEIILKAEEYLLFNVEDYFLEMKKVKLEFNNYQNIFEYMSYQNILNIKKY